MKVGYTTGVYDLFHVGHLNLLTAAKGLCDRLIVGVSTDETVAAKGKHAMIPFEDRIAIIRGLSCVDVAIEQTSVDKIEEYERLKFDVLFVGDDWYGTPRWEQFESKLGMKGVDIIYLPYTHKVSSTKLTQMLKDGIKAYE